MAGARRKLGTGINLGLTSGVLNALGVASVRRGSPGAQASPAGSGGANGFNGGLADRAARQAAERLADERTRLYAELKARRWHVYLF